MNKITTFAKGSRFVKQLFKHVTKQDKIDQMPLFFQANVLEKYRESEAYKLVRTDTMGFLSKQGSWRLDFGISGEDDTFIHFAQKHWKERLPESEHEHWLEYMVSLPMSDQYVQSVVRPGCIEDGDMRDWQ